MDLKGLYPNDAITSKTFSGWKGLNAFAGNPLPSIQIVANREEIYTTESVEFTAHQTYAFYLEWQCSRDGKTWIVVGDSTTAYTQTFPHTTETPGKYWYRCIALNSKGETCSNVIILTVNPRPPQVSITATATEIVAPGSATLAASSEYAESQTWQHSRDGETWTDIPDATDTVLIETYTLDDAGDHHYRCVAKGLANASTTSNTITITVTAS